MNLLIFNALSWEQRKLLDCIQKITDFRGRTPKKLGMDWSEEGYLALSALNVKDGYIDFNQDVHYGNQELYDKWMTGNELHKGQVLFTTEAPMGNVAQVPDNRRYILSQRVIALDVKDNLLTENFLATVLRTPTVFAYLTGLSSGGTAKGVSQKSLSSVEIRLPKDLKEQEKIADTFSNLDHLITLHQSKAESWKNKKNQLSTISWEQRKLGDIAKLINGRAYAQNELLPSGKYKVLRVGNFYTNDSWYYSDLELDDKYYANDGDLLYTWSATFGPHIWRGDRVIYHYHIWKIDLTDELEKHFAVQLLEQDKNDILSGHNGSTMAHITKEGMEQKKVVIPKNIGEQRQLGLFFDNLDNLITLHHRKLNRTQICINRSFLYGSF